MRTVFGIDVSKHTISLTIVVNKVKVDERKLRTIPLRVDTLTNKSANSSRCFFVSHTRYAPVLN